MNDDTGPTERPVLPDAIARGRVIAIARGQPAERLPAIAEALRAGGVLAFEVTLDSPDALAGIGAVVRAEAGMGGGGLLVGAGTVLTIAAAERAVEAGARFLVMPHTDPALVAWAAGQGIPAFPGAMTPSEILSAWRAGAAAVKLFPAASLGPGFLREVRGPLGAIPLVPTGGISATNVGGFIAAGAVAVGVGGWLTGSGDSDVIRARAAELLGAI